MLKKISAVIAAVFCVTLAGCDQIMSDKPDFNKGYSFNAEIVYNNAAVKGTFTRISEGVWEGVLTEPYAVQGLDLRYDKGKMTFSLGGLSVAFENGVSAENPSARLMLDALENAVLNSGFASGDKTSYKINGETIGSNNLKYTLIMSKAGNLPVSLEIPGMNIKVNFTECIITDLKPYDPAYFEDDIIDNSEYY